MPLSDFQDQTKVMRDLCQMMADRDLLPAAAAVYLYKGQSPYDLARAETILDEMWDKKLCCNMGEFCDYAYRLTDVGKAFLNGTLSYGEKTN